jgi:hypothetical protein
MAIYKSSLGNAERGFFGFSDGLAARMTASLT